MSKLRDRRPDPARHSAGAFIPVQTGFNAELARALKGPNLRRYVVFISGGLGLALVAIVSCAGIPK